MKTLPQKFLFLILIGFVFFSCNNNEDVIIKSKEKEKVQGLTSLEGTVWVHRSDTDPNNMYNWFNFFHCPSWREEAELYDLPVPDTIKISFLENGKIDVPLFEQHQQVYFYSYSEPYISIVMMPNFKGVEDWSFERYVTDSYVQACPLTIDNWKCDTLKCKAGEYHNPDKHLKCVHSYWYLGKVNGDTMHLQQINIDEERIYYPEGYKIWRDIYLVRIK